MVALIPFHTPTLTDEARNGEYIAFGETVSPNLAYTEYTIPGSETDPTTDRRWLSEGSVQMTQYEKRSTTITAQVDAETDALIELPLFGYDGYRAQVGGEEMEISLGENNRLTVHLPAGTKGELRVWFAGKGAWRAAELASLLAAAALIAGRRGKKRR